VFVYLYYFSERVSVLLWAYVLMSNKRENNKGIIISDKADPNWTPIIYEENILGRSSNEAFNFSNKRKQYFLVRANQLQFTSHKVQHLIKVELKYQ
jgi:hypothetical protein